MSLLTRRVALAALFAVNTSELRAQSAGGVPSVAFGSAIVVDRQLDNGLRIVLVPDPSAADVTLNVTYLVGSKHEGYGEKGMAHLLEHLLFRGTARHPDLLREYATRGARKNAVTGHDHTSFFITIRGESTDLAWAMDVEADRMRNARLTEEYLNLERGVVKNELAAKGANNPAFALLDQVIGTAFLWHGYGHPVPGTPSDLDSVDVRTVRAFYTEHYRPDNAVVFVVGRMDTSQVLPLIARTFGSIPSVGGPPVRTYTEEPPQQGERHVVVAGAAADDPSRVTVVFHAPPASHEDFVAAQMAARLLARAGSRLDSASRSVGGILDLRGWTLGLRDRSLVVLEASLPSHGQPFRVREQILTLAESLTVDDAAVRDARAGLTAEMAAQARGTEQTAFQLGYWAAMGDWRLMALHDARIRTVTPGAVRSAARRYLRRSNATTGVLLPSGPTQFVRMPLRPTRDHIASAYRQLAAEQDVSARSVRVATAALPADVAKVEGSIIRQSYPNGLSVVILPRPGRAVEGRLYLRIGGAPARSGHAVTAELVRRLLARSMADSAGPFHERLMATGGSLRFGGDASTTWIRIESPAGALDSVLAVLADVLRQPSFDDNGLTRERTILRTELLSGRTDPYRRGEAVLSAHLFTNDAELDPGLANPEDAVTHIDAVTLEDVRRFHAERYGADNAVLTMVGDVNPQQLTASMRRHFATWTSAEPHDAVAASQTAQGERIRVQIAGKPAAFVFVGTGLNVGESHADYAALLVANHILGSSRNDLSRLRTRLRHREGVSYRAVSFLLPDVMIPRLQIEATAPAASADQVADWILAEVVRLRTEGVMQQEVDAARGPLLESLRRSRRPDRLPTTLAQHALHGRTLASDIRLEERLGAVTAAEVTGAIRKYIDPARLVVVLAGDFAAPAQRPQG